MFGLNGFLALSKCLDVVLRFLMVVIVCLFGFKLLEGFKSV